MNTLQKGVIALVNSALDGQSRELPEGLDFGQAFQIALDHKIIAMVYYGALNCGIDRRSEKMRELFRYVVATMTVTEKQQQDLDRLLKALREADISHLPLKGTVLRSYYPKPEMRTMGDADILIRMEQYPAVQKLMESLGFAFDYESDHELVWKTENLVVELHKHMIPTYDADYYRHFGDGWGLAKPLEGSVYTLSDEDQYIYLFTHFTKHYRMSGIGIKHLVDLWVYRQNKPELDEAYISRKLETMGLERFHCYVMDTVRVWFAGGQPTDRTDYITEILFSSGEYGLTENTEVAALLLRTGENTSAAQARRRGIWRAIFLPYTYMCQEYPVLKKAPVLLPVFWVVRWCRKLFGNTKRVFRAFKRFSMSSDKKIDQRKQALAFVGLELQTGEREE